MNEYTSNTRAWLDERFRMTDGEAIYYAHQPIYGFRAMHSEPGAINRYLITWQIMRALSGLEFDSLLDAGGAEGYKAALARELFGVTVRNADLSGEACARAMEIFGIAGESVDIHALPYGDGEFDVVLCSETLEHVADVDQAVTELLRVCRKAVVLTVPHESAARIAANVAGRELHAHIHHFNRHSFDHLEKLGLKVLARRYHEPVVKLIAYAAGAEQVAESAAYPRSLIRFYNWSVPILRRLCGRSVVSALACLDDVLAKCSPMYAGVLVVIVKDERCLLATPRRRISMRQVVDFAVPYHRLNGPGVGTMTR